MPNSSLKVVAFAGSLRKESLRECQLSQSYGVTEGVNNSVMLFSCS